MNKLFLPNPQEEQLIQIIQQVCRNEFVLIRLTKTMLVKGIMDASEGLRNLLFKENIINFEEIQKQEKILKKTIVVYKNTIHEIQTSYYRPQTKMGDPRFWISRLKKLYCEGTLIYFTHNETQLVCIPLLPGHFETAISNLFITDRATLSIEKLKKLFVAAKAKGYIKSVSPVKSNPKDVGHTLENELGLPANSLRIADYEGEIEIKSKRKNSKTKDSLFSCVPSWEKSKIKSAAQLILKYGYTSKKHPGFTDLYVTVNNKANRQGLFLEPQPKIEQLYQYAERPGDGKMVSCIWDYSQIRKRLNEKHPTTVWVIGEEKIINGEIHFFYESLELTRNPIFSQFTSLVGLGIITFDWRGKVRPDNTGYKDHGHGFRIKPVHRKLLFGESKIIEI